MRTRGLGEKTVIYYFIVEYLRNKSFKASITRSLKVVSRLTARIFTSLNKSLSNLINTCFLFPSCSLTSNCFLDAMKSIYHKEDSKSSNTYILKYPLT